jgi:hypothetical protein
VISRGDRGWLGSLDDLWEVDDISLDGTLYTLKKVRDGYTWHATAEDMKSWWRPEDAPSDVISFEAEDPRACQCPSSQLASVGHNPNCYWHNRYRKTKDPWKKVWHG